MVVTSSPLPFTNVANVLRKEMPADLLSDIEPLRSGQYKALQGCFQPVGQRRMMIPVLLASKSDLVDVPTSHA